MLFVLLCLAFLDLCFGYVCCDRSCVSLSQYVFFFFFQAEYGIRYPEMSRGSEMCIRDRLHAIESMQIHLLFCVSIICPCLNLHGFDGMKLCLSLIHISEPTRHLRISYAVFCLKKKQANLTFIDEI